MTPILILFYVLIGAVILMVAGFLGIFLIGALTWIQDKMLEKKLRKSIPKKEDGSLDLDKMLSKGKPNINEKEVQEIDRQKFAKFREFEKLRRLAASESESGGDQLPKEGKLLLQGTSENAGRESIQTGPDSGNIPTELQPSGDEGDSKETGQLTRPAEI